MPAVPRRRGDSLLTRLEKARHRRPGARHAERLLRGAGSLRLSDAGRVIRLHEATLFLRAYPHSPGVLRLAEGLLAGFERRVTALAAAGEDLTPFDAPEVAGIAGTEVGTDFSYEIARLLALRHAPSVRIDWDAGEESDRMRATWPAFLPLLEEEGLADANVPYLAWLGRRRAARRGSRVAARAL